MQPQSLFGPYRIEELLGRGGMGEVYRAHDTETDRRVALKLLPAHLAEDDEYQARFRRECKVAARLSEPHVVPIHRYGEIDGRLFLDMRLVKGSDLNAWLRAHGPMAADVAVAVVGQVAQALDAAHADGLVHRDVKPSNVLLDGISGPEVEAASVFAYLFDFGIARARDGSSLETDERSLTLSGVMPGSPSYVAPERFAGVEGDPRADIYSLACVLHQALVGRPPFEGDLPALMRAHLQTPPPKASLLRPGVPSGLDDVVAKGMAKDPETRYSTAGQLASAARAVLGTGSGFVPTADSTVNIGDRTVRRVTASTAVAPSRTTPRQSPRPGTGSRDMPRPGTVSRDVPRPGTVSRDVPRPLTAAPPVAAARPAAPAPPAWTPPPYEPVREPPAPPAEGRPGRLVWVVGAVFVALAVAGGIAFASLGTSAAPGATRGSSTATKPLEDTKLLAKLPAGFAPASCVADTVMRDTVGALSYVNCNNGPTTGPDTAAFARFATPELLEKEFVRAADEAKLPGAQSTDTIDKCRDRTTIRSQWGREDQSKVVVPNGSIACFVDLNDKSAWLLWTDRTTLGFGYVHRTDGNAAMLYDWWRTADF